MSFLDTKSRKASARGGGLWEFVLVIIQALVLALLVRTFLYQPFNIPSGSMKSTLLVGDYIFVSKMSYGYSRYSFQGGLNLFSGRKFASLPTRGDVAVFKLPRDTSVDYIKRVIGLPGDRIQMVKGVLYINDKAVPKVYVDEFDTVDCDRNNQNCRPVRYKRYQETLPNNVKHYTLDLYEDGGLDNTDVYNVPEGHYFMMGDNRDNSEDSRVTRSVGPVPVDNFIGRADVIWFSGDEAWSFLKFWTWPSHIRWSRFFSGVR